MLQLAHTVREKMKVQQSVKAEWQREAQQILNGFNGEQKRRYDSLDRLIKSSFVNGELNPSIISGGIKDSDYFFQTLDLGKDNVGVLIDAMSKQFARIKRVAEKNGAKVIVVSVPFGIYVSPGEFAHWQEYGFHMDRKMLISNSPDQAISLACEKAMVPFFTATDRFREHTDTHFFYELDGHFDASGHQFYADQLTPSIDGVIRKQIYRHNLGSTADLGKTSKRK